MLGHGLWLPGVRWLDIGWLGVPQLECSHDASAVGVAEAMLAVKLPVFSSRGMGGDESSELNFVSKIELKSLILAQIERWRHALHMQVERGEGATPHSVANG